MNKVAIIFGITGQDGSYLAEFLLSKGYVVHGVIRRASTFNTARIDHIYEDIHADGNNLILHYGDLTDTGNIFRLVSEIRPDEIYHLGAQSHVRVSFDMPEYTANTDALGTLRILEAIRNTKLPIKFYMAASSEMFGSAQPPQNEKTPFHPRSPYAVSKVFSHDITRLYREAYGIFACNGILFNHETVASFMPMFCKNSNEKDFDIKPIKEIVSFDETKKHYQSRKISGLQVWGKNGWVDVMFASAYPHDIKKDNKQPSFINSRAGAFMATGSHVAFLKNGSEKKVQDINIGDCLEIVDVPKPSNKSDQLISKKEAELIGLIVGDGSITYSKKGIGLNAKFTNSSKETREHFGRLWSSVTGGSVIYYPSKSGFNPKKIVGQLSLKGGNDWLRKLDIYNKDKTKRIPKIILNSSSEIMLSFLKGYNISDGLKKNPCVYEFKNFKTNSAVLAMGLWYLIDNTTKQDVNLTLEIKDDGRIFYSLNILSTVDNLLKEERIKNLIPTNLSQRAISRETGISRTFIRKIQHGGSCCIIHHLKKNPLEVKKIIDLPEYDGWFYDLETSSGEFHCGIGKCHVHNSPRRGETFVTKKITRGIARIKAGLDKKLYLGNLDAKRDWGFAPCYVEAMHLILQQDKADDYVIGTGETHTVREFLEQAFLYSGLGDWKQYVEIDSKYFRPAEVDVLIADANKAKEKIGWEPKIRFNDLVKIMIDADFRKLNLPVPGEGDKIILERFSNKWWKND